MDDAEILCPVLYRQPRLMMERWSRTCISGPELPRDALRHETRCHARPMISLKYGFRDVCVCVCVCVRIYVYLHTYVCTILNCQSNKLRLVSIVFIVLTDIPTNVM